jgi:hypothetical protein
MKFEYYALLGYFQRVVAIPYRTVGKELNATRCVIVQKSAVLVFYTAEA